MIKSIFNYLLIILSMVILSCGKDNDTKDLLIGKWKDDYNYPSKINDNGILKDTSYNNIIYTFKSDYTFNVENELPYSINNPGTFSFVGDSSIILMPERNPLITYNVKYEWKIEKIDEEKMMVIYKYEGDPIEPNGQPIVFEYIRNFTKIN